MAVYHQNCVNDKFHYLSSVNIFYLLSAETAAGRYYNYDIFGYPVNEHTVLGILLILFLILTVSLLIIFSHFTKGRRRSRRIHAAVQRVGGGEKTPQLAPAYSALVS